MPHEHGGCWCVLKAARPGFSITAPMQRQRAGRTESTPIRGKTRPSPPKVQSDVKPPYATSTMSPHMPMVCVWKCVGPSVHVVNRLDGRSCITSIYPSHAHMGRNATKRAVGRHTRRRDRVLHTKLALALEIHVEAPGCAASSRRQSAGLEVDMLRCWGVRERL